MNNGFNSHPDRISMLAPAGGILGGHFYKFGKIFGCAVTTAKEGHAFTLDTWAQFRVTETAVADLHIGDAMFLAGGNITSDSTAAGAVEIGTAGASINGAFGRPDQPLLLAGTAGEIVLIVR